MPVTPKTTAASALPTLTAPQIAALKDRAAYIAQYSGTDTAHFLNYQVRANVLTALEAKNVVTRLPYKYGSGNTARYKISELGYKILTAAGWVKPGTEAPKPPAAAIDPILDTFNKSTIARGNQWYDAVLNTTAGTPERKAAWERYAELLEAERAATLAYIATL